MREVTELNIAPNGQIQLAPGGKHLMLMGPKKHLTTGQQVDMTLTFKSGKKQTVTIKVAAQ
jgi:copper(I)-binding protein